jgi:sugar transferase (PEP-CTERM/EpsH1 system associated)
MKILVLDEEFPYPLNTGKRIRSYHLLRGLARRHEVHYLAYGQEASPGFEALAEARMNPIAVPRRVPPKSGLMFYIRLLTNRFSRDPYIVTSHYSREFHTALDDALHRIHPDVVLCEWTPYAMYVQSIQRPVTMIAAHNIESDIWRRYLEYEKSPIKKWYIRRQWKKVARFEKAAFDWVDGITAVSEADAQAILVLAGNAAVRVVENGVDPDYFAGGDPPLHSTELVFTGSMDWRPNQDAADYFVRDIFPALRERYPSLSINFVGRNPSTGIIALGRVSGVTVTGTVDDVRPYIRRAAVYIVPLRIGGGSRLKILEALAMRKAVVSTSVGAEGLAVEDNVHVRLADNPVQFAERIGELLDDPPTRARLGHAGRELVEKRYSWDSLVLKLEEFITGLASVQKSPPAGRPIP